MDTCNFTLYGEGRICKPDMWVLQRCFAAPRTAIRQVFFVNLNNTGGVGHMELPQETQTAKLHVHSLVLAAFFC